MKKIIFYAAVFACAAGLFAISDSEAKALLEKAQDNTAFYETDFKGSYTVVQSKPGEGQSLTKAIMYRRDKTGSWTILVTGPAKADTAHKKIIVKRNDLFIKYCV